MQAANPDVFALRNSGMDAFLYADVGAELNGSRLTILSVLARLGKDPWAQAAGWAALPRANVIDDLSQCIAQMPLEATARAASRDIAARLVQLLPVSSRPVILFRAVGATRATAQPDAQQVMIVWCWIALWIVLSVVLMIKPPVDGGPSNERPIASPGSTSRIAAPPTSPDVAKTPATPILPMTQEKASGQ